MPQGTGTYGSKKGRPAKKKKGLYDNIAAKKKRIAAGSGEKMRKAGLANEAKLHEEDGVATTNQWLK